MSDHLTNKTGKIWGGRFTEAPNETFSEFNDSFRFDQRLFAADAACSIAHAGGLLQAGLLKREDYDGIKATLTQMIASSSEDGFFDSDVEDVHSFIEGKLTAAIGDAGRKLHTGRSRNDQVATAFRYWLRGESDHIDRLLHLLQSALVDLATRHSTAVIPGYTHLQKAQPILFAHWCLAYFEMLKRDRERIADSRRRLNIMPLGSGALAGTGFAIDRESIAAELGFDGVSINSLDGVSDRDFAVEFVAACSLVMTHLSRIAEDLIIYCSNEFGYVTLSDAVSSGSSLMPQKKNPDALELLRGKAGRVFGHNIALLTMIKGLPLAYNKDMQEDKEAVFDCVDTVNISLRAAAIVVENVTVNEERSNTAAGRGYLNATDLADHLVRSGMPFRLAHEAVGKLVLLGIDLGKELHEMSLDELRSVEPSISDDVFEHLAIENSLATKSATGGTSPDRVAEALENAKQYLRNN